MPRSCRFLLADVFTDVAFGGNQLAVYPDARGLAGHEMQALAREFNFPESAFVLPPDDPSCVAKVRIFTPMTELPFAGHPTVGTSAVLLHIGHVTPEAGGGTFVLEEGIGPVTIEYGDRDGRRETTLLLRTTAEVREAPDLAERAAAALSLPRDQVQSASFASVGVPFCIARLVDTDAVDRAVVNYEAWSRGFDDAWSRNIYFLAGDVENDGALYARMFAPSFGIPEDPATGGAAAAFAGAAVRTTGRAGAWEIRQGVAMGRPSLLRVSAIPDGSGRAAIRVGGSTVIIAEGSVSVPDHVA